MHKIALFTVAFMCSVACVRAEYKPIDQSVCSSIERMMNEVKPAHLQIGKVGVDTAMVDAGKSRVKIDMNEVYGYVPSLEEYTEKVKTGISAILGGDYDVEVTVLGRPVEELYIDADAKYVKKKEKEPFVYAMDELRHPKKGLDGKIIAMWQSHGFYFEPKEDRWEWQRARDFQTVEDLYTQSFVMPFLMPMLENAGAYVMSPRERDINPVEIIIDNDGGVAVQGYSESNGEQAWNAGSTGFAYKKAAYRDFENPFADGTYRQVKTTKGESVSEASWTADIPKAGKYAVYVSYATLPESTVDALYTVHEASGDRQFRVNQKMGGGTWIYLGHFYFKAGKQAIVSLSNKSSKKGAIVTADAVKVGGGYGNIERKAPDVVMANVKSSEYNKKAETTESRIKSEYQLSGYPRYTEAARYWLQWAGMPDSVYSPSEGVNDYTDDYRCRGLWVNYLAGGSSVLPDREGLNIPVDLSFAFHSDAGTTMDDSIIGSLGIYYDHGGKYVNGTERVNSRQLTDYVMTNIVNDVRAQYDSNWTRRGMWDASYFEARVPEVPAMLLELLSHQNFADMRYGLDPTFRFTVSRAIYKGMVEFFAAKEGREDYMIQPLPVNSFSITKVKDGEYRLAWKATADTLCDRADATSFVVYERVGDGAFSRIAVTETPEYTVQISDNEIHSYQIVAANDGGLSFPSEILALGEAAGSKGDVLVVNGFTRIAAPDSFDSGAMAGFWSERDRGVPYMVDINYIGDMFEFRRKLPWFDDDSAGFGASRANYEDKTIAGNVFDYPYMHGVSIMKAGYSFVSASTASVENGMVDMAKYKYADMIFGKQKETVLGRGEKPNRYRIYTPALQSALKKYCENGGNLLITGSYVATDVWDNEYSDDATREFVSGVLGYQWRVGQATVEGCARLVPTYFPEFGHLTMNFMSELNSDFYSIESPDGLIPADKEKGCVLMRYTENNIPAAVVNQFDNYKTCIVGFPFETIKESDARDALMQQVLSFFSAK